MFCQVVELPQRIRIRLDSDRMNELIQQIVYQYPAGSLMWTATNRAMVAIVTSIPQFQYSPLSFLSNVRVAKNRDMPMMILAAISTRLLPVKGLHLRTNVIMYHLSYFLSKGQNIVKIRLRKTY